MGQFSRAGGGGGGGGGGGHEDPLKAISHHRHWQRVMRKISGRVVVEFWEFKILGGDSID